MPAPLYSTNLRSPDVDLKGALLQGQAPDKGLYMPREIPGSRTTRLSGSVTRPTRR